MVAAKNQSVHVDFNNADPDGFIRLNTVGCIEDLSRMGITLLDGLLLPVTDGEVAVNGTVHAPSAEGVWRLLVDWDEVFAAHARNASEERREGVDTLI